MSKSWLGAGVQRTRSTLPMSDEKLDKLLRKSEAKRLGTRPVSDYTGTVRYPAPKAKP
jgi:hypothetical protein